MKKVIIGLVGETGSGKDTVANYYKEKYGAKLMRFADPIKDTLSIYFSKLSKEDQAWLYVTFKKRFGEDILSRAMKKRVADEDSGFLVVNGLRMPTDFDFIKSLDGAKVLYVTADQEVRWSRVTKRGEKTDDDISLEEFKRLDEKETEIHIPSIGKKADFKIVNEKDLDYLLAEADKFVAEIGVLPLSEAEKMTKKIRGEDDLESDDIESEIKLEDEK